MFGFLKDKLKKAVDKFSKSVDKESVIVEEPQAAEKAEEQIPRPAPEKEVVKKPKKPKDAEKKTEEPAKGFFGKLKDKFKQKPEDDEEPAVSEAKAEEPTASVPDVKTEEPIAVALETKTKEPEALQANKPALHKRQAKTGEVQVESSGKIQGPIEPEARKTGLEKPSGDKKNTTRRQTTKDISPPETSVKEPKADPVPQKKEEPHKLRHPIRPAVIAEEPQAPKGFFGKIRESVVDAVTKTSISEEKFEELFWDLEIILLENNVAVEVIEKIKSDLKLELVEKKIRRGKTLEIISDTLARSIKELFISEDIDLISRIRSKKPYIIVFVGINGSGKTTTIAKFAHMLKENNLSCVMAAADTFRAAAIQQLEEHAEKLEVKLIKHDYGADPAAVAFDAIKYAQSKRVDCVLIDTAGRLHSNTNLIDEMKKIVRVAKPDLKIFVGESITGNDCVEQAQKFNEAVEIDGIILAKADVDDKGGAAISVSYVTGKPILYIGTGQNYGDLKRFEPELVIESLGLKV